MNNEITVVSYCHPKHECWIPHWIEQLNQQTYKKVKILLVLHNWLDDRDYDEYFLWSIRSKLMANGYMYVFMRRYASEPVIGRVINYALEEIDTEYFAHWDLDDVFHPDRLKLQARFLAEHPDVDFLGSRMIGFYGDPKPEMYKLDYKEPDEPFVNVVYNEDIKRCLVEQGHNCLGHSTMVYKAQIMKDIGGFSLDDVKTTKKSPDFETWRKALQAGYKFHRLPELLALWRLDSSSIRS